MQGKEKDAEALIKESISILEVNIPFWTKYSV